jgi:thymidylate synthase
LQANRTGVKAVTTTGAMMKFDMAEGFPAVTTKKLAFKQVKGELLGFLRAYDNAADFRSLGCSIWDQNANEHQGWLTNPHRKGHDDLGRVYGVQWRYWKAGDGFIDQVADALQTIMNDPSNRRIIINAWRPDEFHLMALPPCFTADTLVTTPEGYRPISDINEGDFVISSQGNIRRVNQVWATPYAGEMKSIQVKYTNTPIKCTPNHPFMVKGKGWLHASEIRKGDYLAVRRTESKPECGSRVHQYVLKDSWGNFNEHEHKLTLDDYFMLGYFLGNGWVGLNSERVSFAVPNKKSHYLLERLRKSIKVSRKPNSGKNCATYETHSHKWTPLLRQFGHTAPNKKIPEWVFAVSEEEKREFISGYFEADGYQNHMRVQIAVTTSQQLALGLQRLLASLGEYSSVNYQTKPEKCVIEGREVNQKPVYNIDYRPLAVRKSYTVDDEYVYVPVYCIDTYYDEVTVFNLDVEEDHTYQVSNIVTHNCHVLYEFTVNVEKNQLNLVMFQRSADCFLGVPFNVASASLLLCLFARLTGTEPGAFTHFLADTHIYENHIDQVDEQLTRTPYPLPQLWLDDAIQPLHKDATRDDIDVALRAIQPDHIKLFGYESHDSIKAPMAV